MKKHKVLNLKKKVEDNYKNICTYIEPHKYTLNKNKIHSADFNKMRGRKKNLHEWSLDFPTMNSYEPKYSAIEKNMPKIYFNPKDQFKDKMVVKRNKLRRIWTSYKVDSKYEIVDNSKIKNAKDINFDLWL